MRFGRFQCQTSWRFLLKMLGARPKQKLGAPSSISAPRRSAIRRLCAAVLHVVLHFRQSYSKDSLSCRSGSVKSYTVCITRAAGNFLPRAGGGFSRGSRCAVGFHNTEYKFRYRKLSTTSTKFSTAVNVEASMDLSKMELYGKTAIEVLFYAKVPD